MEISINLADGVPIYRQIANQIRYMIASRLLKPGEEIPPIRTLALQLKVTPNTIVKAYDELESAGIVRKRQGSGTYVSEGPSPLADRERNRIIEDTAYQHAVVSWELHRRLKKITVISSGDALVSRHHTELKNFHPDLSSYSFLSR